MVQSPYRQDWSDTSPESGKSGKTDMACLTVFFVEAPGQKRTSKSPSGIDQGPPAS
jgi:hypothetical protein